MTVTASPCTNRIIGATAAAGNAAARTCVAGSPNKKTESTNMIKPALAVDEFRKFIPKNDTDKMQTTNKRTI